MGKHELYAMVIRGFGRCRCVVAIEEIRCYLMPAIHTHKTHHGVWGKENSDEGTSEDANGNGSETSESGNDANDDEGTDREDQ